MISTKITYSSLISKGRRKEGRKEEEKEEGGGNDEKRKRARQARKILFSPFAKRGNSEVSANNVIG